MRIWLQSRVFRRVTCVVWLLLVVAGSPARAETCFSPADALDSLGPYDEVLSSEHFAVHFNTDPLQDVDEQRVAELLLWFEESLEVMTADLGFNPPELIDEYQLLVAVERLPSPTTGAFTSLRSCGLTGQMAFIVLNSQWFPDDQKLQSLAAHELFHAIQVRYSFEPFWGEDATANRWWIEASAAYMEWQVFPELNKRQQAHARQWARQPWRALRSHDGSGFQYGTWLLAASIEQSLEDDRWHSQLWDGFLGRDDLDVIEDLDALLAESDTSFAEQYGAFIERAATMEFDFNAELDTPAALWDDGEGGLVASHQAEELPLDAIILASDSPPAPQTLGTSYVRVHAPDTAQTLRIDVASLLDAGGNSRAFEVRLVAIEDGDASLNHRLVLKAEPGSNSESGSILLDGFGSTFEALIIAASPTLSAIDGSDGSWSYSLSLNDSTGGVGFVVVETDLGNSNGCQSCSQGSAAPAAAPSRLLVALLLLSIITARRHERQHGGL